MHTLPSAHQLFDTAINVPASRSRAVLWRECKIIVQLSMMVAKTYKSKPRWPALQHINAPQRPQDIAPLNNMQLASLLPCFYVTFDVEQLYSISQQKWKAFGRFVSPRA